MAGFMIGIPITMIALMLHWMPKLSSGWITLHWFHSSDGSLRLLCVRPLFAFFAHAKALQVYVPHALHKSLQWDLCNQQFLFKHDTEWWYHGRFLRPWKLIHHDLWHAKRNPDAGNFLDFICKYGAKDVLFSEVRPSIIFIVWMENCGPTMWASNAAWALHQRSESITSMVIDCTGTLWKLWHLKHDLLCLSTQ